MSHGSMLLESVDCIPRAYYVGERQSQIQVSNTSLGMLCYKDCQDVVDVG